jgi:hypothetical protein
MVRERRRQRPSGEPHNSRPETSHETSSARRRVEQSWWNAHLGAILGLLGVVAAAAIVAGTSFLGILASNSQQERAGFQQYQSDLVLRALEPDDAEEREELLEFLLATQLLTDEEVREGLTAYLRGPNELPQFRRLASQVERAAAQFGELACHPSYDPCVPNVSDVDCEGGTGDGPAYTGRVTVIGPDVYHLDVDGDGTGCE